MKRVLIIGAGDLGQQIAHYVSESSEYEIVGYVDDWANVGDIRRGYPVLGCIDETANLYQQGRYDELLIGIGYKHFDTRKQIFDRFYSIIPFATYIHPSCYIDTTSKIGAGVIILPKCIVDFEAILEDNVFIYSGSVIGHNVIIGSHSVISLSVTVGGFSVIEQSSFLGLGVCVRDNIRIAQNTFIGAGSNVINNIDDNNGIYVGNPARWIKQQ